MKKRLLLVEDDVMNKKVIKLILERKGDFEVLLSEDPLEIFSLARSNEVDILLVDISLTNSFLDGKEVNGIRISRILKDDPLTSLIPIIITTAHAMKGDCERFLQESGADGYISKPIEDIPRFVGKVNEVLRNSSNRGAS
ncbi:MAG: response regulator [Armatimonadetes bacterium]|nr:response regulator [Armatimonadota bacterium]